MKNDVVPVQIRGILPANSGCALFVGNDEKVFVINVEPNMGAVIGMFLRETPKERPLTHDLIQSIFKGFNINVERVVITELKNSTYFARLILAAAKRNRPENCRDRRPPQRLPGAGDRAETADLCHQLALRTSGGHERSAGPHQ